MYGPAAGLHIVEVPGSVEQALQWLQAHPDVLIVGSVPAPAGREAVWIWYREPQQSETH